MKAVFELAEKYYPTYWSKERFDVFLAKKKLTHEEYNELMNIKKEEALACYPKLSAEQVKEIRKALE